MVSVAPQVCSQRSNGGVELSKTAILLAFLIDRVGGLGYNHQWFSRPETGLTTNLPAAGET